MFKHAQEIRRTVPLLLREAKPPSQCQLDRPLQTSRPVCGGNVQHEKLDLLLQLCPKRLSHYRKEQGRGCMGKQRDQGVVCKSHFFLWPLSSFLSPQQQQ